MNYTGRGFRFINTNASKPPVKRGRGVLKVVKGLIVATLAGLVGAGGLTALILPVLVIVAVLYAAYNYVLCDLAPALPPVTYLQTLVLAVAARAFKGLLS